MDDYKQMMLSVNQLNKSEFLMMCQMLSVTNSYFDFVRAGVIKPSDDMLRRINTILELLK